MAVVRKRPGDHRTTTGALRLYVDITVSGAELVDWEPDRIAALFRGIAMAMEAKNDGAWGGLGRPLLVDLCGGLGGVAEGFLAAGFEVVGYDIKDHGYPGRLIIQDVREVESIVAQGQGRDIPVLWASPPCQEFTIRDLPWGRLRNLPPPDLSIVNACFELGRRLNPKTFVLENVRGAQPWIGRAPLHRGSRYLWGDVALVPGCRELKVGCLDRADGYKAARRERGLDLAKIPFALSYGLAMACRGGA